MTGRTVAVVLAAAYLAALALAVKTAARNPHTTVLVRKVDGHGVKWWAARARMNGRQAVLLRVELRRERRVLFTSPTVTEAIGLACVTYGSCDTLWRKARCETGGTLNPHAANESGASGLFQFLDSTWRTTPYAAFSVWSPYANALAAGWMHAHGRGNEWACG